MRSLRDKLAGDGTAGLTRKRQYIGSTRLGLGESNRTLLPIDIVEAEPRNLARLQPEIDQTARHRIGPPVRWKRLIERLQQPIDLGPGRHLTFLPALLHERVDAPCLFDGPINGAADPFLIVSS